VSKFNDACANIVEGIDTAETGVAEFTWKNVEDEKHKDSLLKIIKKGPFLFNRTINGLVNKAQNIPRTLDNPYQRLLKSAATSSERREVVEDGNKVILKIHGVPVDPKKISKEFMKSLSFDIQYALGEIVDWNPRVFPNGFPECWKFTSRLTTKYTDLEDKLPELKGIFESTETFPYGLFGFKEPGLKGKFKQGDHVKVEDPQHRWGKYQNEKSKEAISKIGEIVGYKYVPGAYSKYAVKLINGNIYGIHSHFLRPLTDDEIAIGKMVKKLPELEGIFEKSYKNIINATINENVVDGTKEVYGYSLKTFIPEEIELFEALADAVIRDAEKHKASFKSTGLRVFLTVSNDPEYLKIKHRIVNHSLLHSAWREFYAPAIIDVGIPSLNCFNDEFYLNFSFRHPQFPQEVSESRDWKKHLMTALKLSVTDMFFNCFDSVSGGQYAFLSPELKEFFDWREHKIKLSKLTQKLPELGGIFEANKLEDQAMLKLTFSKLSPEDKELLLKYIRGLEDPNEEARVISDTVVQYIRHDMAYEWCKKESKKSYPAYKHSMLSWMLQMPNIPLTDRETRSFISRIFKNCEVKVLLSKYDELTQKLPELEGIFESKEETKNYIVEVVVKKSSNNQDNTTIKTLLNKMIVLQDIYYKVTASFTETQEAFIYKFPQTLGDIIKTDKKKYHEDTFVSYFTQEYNHLVKHLNCKPFKTWPVITFNWFDEKFYGMYKKLPELEGIFEAVAELTPNFHLMKEEEAAIEEIAETVQKLFQDYEERIVALMTNLKKTSVEVQDSKLNKYIGITHLRNDLRISVAKICKKHFELIEGNTMRSAYLYNQYERVFEKPIVGAKGLYTGVGVMLKYEDEVFEIVFDTYDATIGEWITVPKSIEPIEIKDYLKGLLKTWLNAIITHSRYYFTNEYLEFRREKTKFKDLTNKLPELEGIFESEDAQPKYVVHSTFTSLTQNDKYVLTKMLKWRQKTIDLKCKIIEEADTIHFITFGVKYNDRDQIKISYKRMLRIDMDYVFPTLKIQSAEKFIDKIFNNATVVCKEEKLYDLENKLPELKGLFENHQTNFLNKYNLIDPINLKDINDFKELWMGYEFGTTELVDNTFKFFYEFNAKEVLDRNGLSLLRLESPTQLAIIVNASSEGLKRIKDLVNVSEIGDTLANQIRSFIDNLYYSIDQASRDAEDFFKMESVIRSKCLFLGIKTKWSDLNQKLPELEGIFD